MFWHNIFAQIWHRSFYIYIFKKNMLKINVIEINTFYIHIYNLYIIQRKNIKNVINQMKENQVLLMYIWKIHISIEK